MPSRWMSWLRCWCGARSCRPRTRGCATSWCGSRGRTSGCAQGSGSSRASWRRHGVRGSVRRRRSRAVSRRRSRAGRVVVRERNTAGMGTGSRLGWSMRSSTRRSLRDASVAGRSSTNGRSFSIGRTARAARGSSPVRCAHRQVALLWAPPSGPSTVSELARPHRPRTGGARCSNKPITSCGRPITRRVNSSPVALSKTAHVVCAACTSRPTQRIPLDMTGTSVGCGSTRRGAILGADITSPATCGECRFHGCQTKRSDHMDG